LTGGLKYLVENGRSYTEAYQDHAFTKTAAGHSTILTGLNPAHTGIVGNEWYDRAKKRVVYCTDDPIDVAAGNSPRSLEATTLGDWLRRHNRNTKVFAMARKDRSAVLLGGQKPSGVYWFETTNGKFGTSQYYRTDLPLWASVFNRGRPADRYFGTAWDHLLEPQEYQGADDSEGEGDLGGRTFPHRFAGLRPDEAFYTFLTNTPFMDELTLAFAREAITGERLGQRGVP